jgi:hypothetical protein
MIIVLVWSIKIMRGVSPAIGVEAFRYQHLVEFVFGWGGSF